MRILFVSRKAELSRSIEYATGLQLAAYRTRLECNCPVNNSRNGVLVLLGSEVIVKVMRCKLCAKGGVA